MLSSSALNRKNNMLNVDDGVIKRKYSSDNIRFILMLFVVYAHLLEIASPFWGSELIYKIIYSFHMPIFIFLSGYFSKYCPKRIVFNWIIPYFVFQSIYIFFSRYILKIETQLQYTTPYWLLWFILALIFYQFLIPFYNVKNKGNQLFIIFISILIALLVGFDNTIGYYMSISRFFVFQPWFILGLYCRKNLVLENLSEWITSNKKRYFLSLVVLLSLICLSVTYLYFFNTSKYLLYGSYAYAADVGTIWQRMTLFLIAFIWLCFIFFILGPLLEKKIWLITTIGQNTLPIFLLHGFIVKAIPVYAPELVNSPIQVFILTLIIMLLGNKFCKKFINCISFSWLEKKGE